MYFRGCHVLIWLCYQKIVFAKLCYHIQMRIFLSTHPSKSYPCLNSHESIHTQTKTKTHSLKRPRWRGRRRRRSTRRRHKPQNTLRRHPNIHPSNHLPPHTRPRRHERTQTIRPNRNQQRLLPNPRKITCWIRLTCQSHGSGRTAHRRIQWYRRMR